MAICQSAAPEKNETMVSNITSTLHLNNSEAGFGDVLPTKWAQKPGPKWRDTFTDPYLWPQQKMCNWGDFTLLTGVIFSPVIWMFLGHFLGTWVQTFIILFFSSRVHFDRQKKQKRRAVNFFRPAFSHPLDPAHSHWNPGDSMKVNKDPLQGRPRI